MYINTYISENPFREIVSFSFQNGSSSTRSDADASTHKKVAGPSFSEMVALLTDLLKASGPGTRRLAGQWIVRHLST